MMFAWLFSDPLPTGTQAPDFSLPDEAGHMVRLSKLRGLSVVLVFYPGDDTPGCTKQLCRFAMVGAKRRAAVSRSSA
jgi:peroxiredoxin Q/BCP